tara:strand:- start:356 stop:1378 length:1023 start_codon:yes stop_codon:yes gene_type:complete
MPRLYALTLVVVFIAVSVLSLANGAMAIPFSSVIEITLAELGIGPGGDFDRGQHGVLMSIRFPRTILALLVGAGLSVAGALMQGLFRNPLADPGLLGVSSGAALGAALVIVLGTQLGMSGSWSLPIAAFIGATISTLCVMHLSTVGARTVVANMLLAGIAINAIAGAGTGFLVYLADDDQLRDLTFWTLGSFGGASWADVQLGLFLIGIPTVVALFLSRSLNVMLLGESAAYMLGVKIQRLKQIIVVLVCISVGCSVALSGMIGFVGLVVPHLCRLLFGPDNQKVVPASLLLGGSLLLSADLLSRLVIIPAELPIGIVTSIIGGPFFLALLSANRKKGLW